LVSFKFGGKENSYEEEGCENDSRENNEKNKV
jgi:hypothetical protein